MRYIKKFENFENQPEIGDYVICDIYNGFLNYYRYPEDYKFPPESINLMKYTRNKVGKIIDYNPKESFQYIIKYDISEKILNKFRYRRNKRMNKVENNEQFFPVNVEDILFFSKDKELCKAYLVSKKFNL